ncbi:MAG: hypothetical protein E6G03_04100, partial [Actinobacteria bacterium]
MSTRRTRASTAETIDDLVRASSLIFTGTVVAVGRSNLRVLEPRENLVLVRVDSGLRVDPSLGDIRGRVLTTETPKVGELPPGTRAVFFTQSWIHAEE